MKMLTLVAMLCVVSLLGSAVASAGNESKVGTAGAYELLIPVGARGTALAGTAVASITGVEAIHWNPAGVSRGWGESSVEAMFSHMNYLGETSMDYAAVGWNAEGFGTVGLFVRSFSFGDIQETTEALPEGTGRVFSPSYLTFGVTYSKMLTDRISVGFTGKFVNETILRTSASGFALDAGVVYYVGGSGALSGLHFGVALKNIGPNMVYTGEDLERPAIPPGSAPGSVRQALAIPAQAFELPATFELGVGYDANFAGSNRLTVMGQFQNMNFGNDQIRFGAEYAFSEMFFLRGGYQFTDANRDNYLFGGTLGAGFAYGVGSFRFVVDYAYQATDIFQGTNTFALRIAF
ncbi:MAG: PorV/PorQ family protein [Bacteroidetes bacterium]|nr:PorV/PorQ family protein [Bacteroidota bacterium]